MCGIIVIAGRSERRLSPTSVHAALRHRGPDACGCEVVASGGLLFEFGHTRLAIQDLSPAGAQPMWSSDGRWLLAFNGEIYNPQALRRHLQSSYGVAFRGHSDTETLVELIAREGMAAALPKLDGMFAFVALDRATGVLHAARDPVGIKPLYYIEEQGGIAFSSEVRALAAHGFDPGGPDPDAAAIYLQLRYVPSPLTLHRKLRRVAPGTVLSWHRGRLERSNYRSRADGPLAAEAAPLPGAAADRVRDAALDPGRDPVREPPPRSGRGDEAHGDPVARFGARLQACVRGQLIADVPVGVLLSGGLDSAVLAAALVAIGEAPPCFTVGFASHADGRSEIADAAQTARVLGLPHHAVTLDEADLAAVEERVMDHLEEPLGTTSVLAMWHLCRLARSQVTVALAGQGADEPLGGYRRHRLEALRSNLPQPAQLLLRRLASVPRLPGGTDIGRALRTIVATPWLQAYVEARQVFTPAEIVALGSVAPPPPQAVFGERVAAADFATGTSDLARSLWMDARTQLADDLLLYGDKISMAHSLEVRVPYLGTGLLAWMEALPDSSRVDVLRGKRILKAWAQRVLPPAIVGRPKRGFQIPNLFRNRRFLDDSIERARAFLGRDGSGLQWDGDRLAMTIREGAQGGAAEVRAWTLHSLARWMQAHRPQGTLTPLDVDGGDHEHDALRAKDDTTV